MAFFDPSNSSYNPTDVGDILAQQATLTRRQALLDTLNKKNLSTPITGNTGIGQLIASLATTYFNSKNADALDKAQSDNQGAYGNALSNAVSQYLQTREGTPAHPMSGPPTEDQANAGMDAMPGTAPAQPGDPRAALVQAISSRFPEMQMIGKGDLAAMAKGPKYSGTPVAGIGPDGKPVFFQPDEQGGQPKMISGVAPEPKPIVAGDQIYNAYDLAHGPMADGRTKYGPVKNVATDSLGRPIQGSIADTGKIEFAPTAPQTSIAITNPINKAGAEDMFKSAVATVSKLGDAARGANELTGTLKQLGVLDKAGVASGPLANANVWLANLGNAAGVTVDKGKLANSQNYASLAQEAVQAVIAKAGGNRAVTGPEVAMISQIIPQLSSSPAARAQLSQILQNAASRTVGQYQTAQKSLQNAYTSGDPSKFNFLSETGDPVPPLTPIPGTPSGASTPKAVSWSDLK